MKLMHTTTTTLNTKEFNKLSDNIIQAIYDVSPEVSDLYDIHINYVKDSWRIDFLPMDSDLPVLKVETYTEYDNSGREVLKIYPSGLEDFPKSFSFKDKNRSYGRCMNYVALFDFVVSLYDFEYTL